MATTTNVHVATASILDLYEHFAKERVRVLALQGVRDAHALAVHQHDVQEQDDAAEYAAHVAQLEAELADAHARRAQQKLQYTSESAKHTAELETAEKALTEVLYEQDPLIQQLMGIPARTVPSEPEEHEEPEEQDEEEEEALVRGRVGFTNWCREGGHTFGRWPTTKVFDCVRCTKKVCVEAFTPDGEGRFKQPCVACSHAPAPAQIEQPATTEHYTCTSCGVSKVRTEENFKKNGFHPPNKKGERKQKYYGECLVCMHKK